MAVCLNHVDREAVTRCAACRKPICAECVVASVYCSEECRNRGGESKKSSEQVIRARKKTDSAGRIRKVIVFFVLLAIAAAAYLYYRKNQEDIDKQLKSAVGTVKKEVGKTSRIIEKEIQSTGKSIPKSSKYKRDREALTE